jgi:hypothetical protein
MAKWMRWREMNIVAECQQRVKHGLEAIERGRVAGNPQATNAGFNSSEIPLDIAGG